MHFLTELRNTEVSVSLLKSNYTTDALATIFMILGTNKQRKLEFFKRNVAKDVFLIIFKNFHNSSFSNISEKCMK